MFCKDIWKKKIPENKLSAYKQLIDNGLISIFQVIYKWESGTTIVEYNSTVTHNEIKNELRNLSSLIDSKEAK